MIECGIYGLSHPTLKDQDRKGIMSQQRSYKNYTRSKTMLNLVRRSPLTLILIAAVLLVGVVSIRKTQAAKPLAPPVVVQSFSVTGGTPSPTDNDYTRINDAVQAATSGTTIELQGTFDWTEANAAASWAAGSNGIGGDGDDFSILVPANVNNLTITAMSLGAATIEGPGDLAAVNLEAFLVFDGGDNQNFTMSNLRIRNFDLGVGMFNGAGGLDAFNGTQIVNNYFLLPTDLNATVAPADANQNIAIHFSFGMNQTIQNNTIEIPGDGVSDSGNSVFASSVGMQSNTSGGNVYDGLLIDNNTIRVLNGQSADPEVILGIWENAFGHTSNITVSNNDFINLSLDNFPALNLQRAFRVTSHSSATTTVAYSNNTIHGASIGFQWLAGSDFTGNQPVELATNTLTDCNTGVLIQSNGSAHLTDNDITGAGNAGIGVDIKSGSMATIDAATAPNTITTLATAINVEGTATINGNLITGNTSGVGVRGSSTAVMMSFNRVVGNGAGVENEAAITVAAENNWWGCNEGPGGLGCEGLSGNMDFDPWLVLNITAAPGVGTTSNLTASLTQNSDGVDTSASGHVPDGTPVTFGGGAPFGTVAPTSTVTTSGVAMSVFTPGIVPGTATVSATVDNQTVTTTITVVLPSGFRCLLEDANKNSLAINTTTGDYIFSRCNAGITLTGRGTVRVIGCTITLQHNATGYRVTATIDTCQKKGTATVQIFSPSSVFSLIDKNTANNICVCN